MLEAVAIFHFFLLPVVELLRLSQKEMKLFVCVFVVCRELPASVFHVLEGGGKISEGKMFPWRQREFHPQGNFPGRVNKNCRR